MTNTPLLDNLRPWCIGRFVMNRPGGSDVISERYTYWGDKIDIEADVTAGTFQHKVKARENELRVKTRTGSISYKEMQAKGLKSLIVETDIPWLEKTVSPTQTSRVFFYSDDVDHPDMLINEEGYLLTGTTMLTMKSLLRPGDVQQSIELTSDVYRNIVYRDEWTVPSEPGFCVKGALIGGRSRNSEEVKQTILLQPGRAATLAVSMRVAVDGDQQATLLGTLPDLRRDLQAQGHSKDVTVLREGKRLVAGMGAEEVLFSIKDNGIQLFRFYLLAPGVPKTVAKPYVDIQLILGSANSNTLTPEQASSPVDEADAIKIWDSLLNSIRLRPGAL